MVGQGAYAAEYDANGNMTSRVVAGQAQVLEWDAENRLVRVTQGASVSTFTYDGNGNRVQAAVDGVSTVYIGGYYEQTGSTVRTYYYPLACAPECRGRSGHRHAGRRVAMREGGVTTWLLGDHLGSTSVAYRASDGQTTAQRYDAWGGLCPGPENALPTDYAFAGQRLDAQINLYHMGARWYDGAVGRWLSPDTIVPNPADPQGLNRYTWVGNNPLRYIDPTGHLSEDEIKSYYGVNSWEEVIELLKDTPGWLELLRTAHLEDTIAVLRNGGASDLVETLRGKLLDRNGKLHIEKSPGELLDAAKAAAMGDQYYDLRPQITASGTPGFTIEGPFFASVRYYHAKLDMDQVDQTGAIVDVIGIVDDICAWVPGPGTAIYYGSEAIEGWKGVQDQFYNLDFSGPAIDWVVKCAEGARLIPQVGITGNLVSLALNFSHAVYLTH